MLRDYEASTRQKKVERDINTLIYDVKRFAPFCKGYRATAFKRNFSQALVKFNFKLRLYVTEPVREGVRVEMTVAERIEDLKRAIYAAGLDVIPRHDYLLMRTSLGGAYLIAPRVKNLEHPYILEVGPIDSSLVIIFARRPEDVETVWRDLLAISDGTYDMGKYHLPVER